MAETKGEKGKTDKKAPAKKKGGGILVVLFMILLGCLVPFGVPTLLVCLGLLPTFVALFTDTDQNRYGLASVGYMNLAGVLPFLIDLWQNGQTMDAAMAILRDPFSWVVMLGSAGVGHLILYAVPPAVASFILMRQEGRLRVLREGRQQLEAIWGPDVANALPLEMVRHNKGVD